MKTVAIIQARTGSTRFPGKVLEPLGGLSILGWTARAAQAIPGVDRVCVATSDAPGDDPVVEWCEQHGVTCVRGDENNVLVRFAKVAEVEPGDNYLRLTADCPLLDPSVCGMVLAALEASGSDYACNVDPRSWPDGLDCEAFTASALARTVELATDAFELEHVTPFMRAHRELFQVEQVACPVPGVADERWTVDTREDLKFLEAVVQALPVKGCPPSWLDVLRIARSDVVASRPQVPAASTQARPNSTSPAVRHYEKSQKMLERACKVIPLGSQTFSKSHIQYPADAPMFLEWGDGAQVWDIDGNRYIDLVSGLLPVVLGYRDPDVDAALSQQLRKGLSFSLATKLETELAERLVDLIPCAEMVRFGKNGTDATSAAIRLARAFTGRDKVAVCGYHGWQDWYIGATTRNKGVPGAVSELTEMFPYNDIDALDALLSSRRDEFAAVIMEPMSVVEPADGYLAAVKELAHRHGALLVFDEIITGFRFAMGGAQALFGVTPDLACFGKAMANGMPISAVVGRTDVMREMENIFFSGTFGGEAMSLAAAIATIDKMRNKDVIDQLWRTGNQLSEAASKLIEEAGLTTVISFIGADPWKVVSINDHPNGSKAAIETLLIQEMLANGVLINASHNVTYAMSDADIEEILEAYKKTLTTIANELEQGNLDQRMGNNIIRPIFKVRSKA